MQIKSSGVQAVIHDEDRIVNNVTNTDRMLLTCDINHNISIINKGSVHISIELICLTLRGLFVRYISNLPSANDKKLCFTLWQLKWCRKSNDKTVYSKFHFFSLDATNNFDFELHTIKPEQCLKLMTMYGYNLSQERR
jgi:hypothetical protein